MKKKNYLLSLLAIVVAATMCVSLSSCDKKHPVLNVNGISPVNLTSEGTSVSTGISVTAEHTDWAFETSDNWLHASKSGNTLSVSADKNQSTSSRSGQITIYATENRSLSYMLNVTQEGEMPYIKANGNTEAALQFGANGGIAYKQTVRITSNVSWSINNVPSWLSVSPTNGNGEVTLDVYPKTDNNAEDSERSVQLILSAGDTRATITVSQDTDLDSRASVVPTNIITLYNGIAFDYKFGGSVSYYYRGYMERSAVASMTDAEIIEVLEENFPRFTQNDNEVGVFDGLDEGKAYMVYTVGYNKEGKRGKLEKTEVSTKTLKNNEAMAWISDPTNDGSYWHWTVTKSATCYSYYMITTDDLDFATSADVYQAWMIDYYIRTKQTSEYVNGGDWQQRKNGSLIAVMTWGLDKQENFANAIGWNYGIDGSAAPQKVRKRADGQKTDKNYPKTPISPLSIIRK